MASFCQLLQRRYAGQLDERADQYIAFAVDGAQRMQRLINDLLAFSRIGRLTTGFVEVDLNKVMGDVAAQTEAPGEYADGELDLGPSCRRCSGEEPLLTNLLRQPGQQLAEVPPPGRAAEGARLGAAGSATSGRSAARDNGIGIEPEFADKIFVIFQRLHSKDAYPGTGIGLAIVKKIVEYHGGRVWVDTEVAEGTSIRFTLPVLVEDGARRGGAGPGAPESPDADRHRTPTEPQDAEQPTDAGQTRRQHGNAGRASM